MLEKADVKLSTKVSHIETGPDSVTVFTEAGLQLECDEVVMTAPLGWLHKNKEAFQPPLPERFSQAIDSIGYGCLEKVRLRYPRSNNVK